MIQISLLIFCESILFEILQNQTWLKLNQTLSGGLSKRTLLEATKWSNQLIKPKD